MSTGKTWRTAAAMPLITACLAAGAETIGSVDTTFRMVGANDSIEIEAFDDPKIEGVTCHLSRAVTGGVGKWVGTSVDTSDASIACRQIGPIRITAPLEDGRESLQRAQVHRLQDPAGRSLLRPQAQYAGLPRLLHEGDRGLAEEFNFHRAHDAVGDRRR